ncbi:LysR family transcriptional regulator [Tateyamaria sp. SN6-1]|uniref:LysR family transcriptional regulator n=1 Tax=Tateyamaria sp. SN6-1 TaxID=3092148 RepID=UPI0039F4DB1B
MDYNFDWTRLRAFLATADTGSYSAAARALGLTQPTLGRQVAALEAELGMGLFERAGRGLRLTEAGQDLLPDARQMEAAATRISTRAQGRAEALEGQIRVTASDLTSARLLPGILQDLRRIAPGLRIDLIASNDIRDILRREADIAIRHVRPTEPDLIARFVRDAPAHLYASHGYIASRGAPKTLDDLQHHDFVSLGDDTAMVDAMRARGIVIRPENFRAGSDSGIAVWELVRQGFGLFPMSDSIAKDDPDMVRVLEGVTHLTFPIWLVTHRDLHTSRRIRLVFDHLAAAMQQD